jgi:hypothetical protein
MKNGKGKEATFYFILAYWLRTILGTSTMFGESGFSNRYFSGRGLGALSFSPSSLILKWAADPRVNDVKEQCWDLQPILG